MRIQINLLLTSNNILTPSISCTDLIHSKGEKNAIKIKISNARQSGDFEDNSHGFQLLSFIMVTVATFDV